MVHLRINEKEPNPNPHINFITALPDPNTNEHARQLLRALAAQIKPVMKKHGFSVNSLEEYEWNRVFAGRNWNAGETVEIVLRGQHGSFLSTSWLLNVVCHEIAHIQHMNHSSAFHKLWVALRTEVLELQRKGYYGDGYWSSGQRLSDSAVIGGDGLESGELPEYLCGGAQSRSRPTGTKRRRTAKNAAGPSKHTGAQTAKRLKAGSRIKTDFVGDGVALNDGLEDKGKGVGFRKKAQSNRAREERALAAEKRILALQKLSQAPASDDASESESESDSHEPPVEQDDDRRRTMLEANVEGDSNSNTLKGRIQLEDYADYFHLPRRVPTVGPSRQVDGVDNEVIEIEDDGEDFGCDSQPASNTYVASANPHTKLESKPRTPAAVQGEWNCSVCTLSNRPEHLACDACGTTKGENEWKKLTQ